MILKISKGLNYATAIAVLSIGLGACGGGGGTPATPATPAAANVTVSGTVTYTDFEISGDGINFASPTNRPIRGAVVELHNPLDTIVSAANTTETGGYSFSNAPANSTISIVVKAALGTTTAPDTKVIDNTNSDNAIYALTQAVTTATSNVTTNFNAGSGWDTTTNSYTTTRAAAPFAILDTIHQGQLFVRSADAAVVFPPLNVKWSKVNKEAAATAQNEAIGDGPGSSFGDGIWLNGSPNLDTDEYDSAVIAHEWGHYFQDELGRSDSSGGDHSAEQIVHPSLAMDEGYATALGSMIMNDTAQINTFKTNPANADILLENIETDSVDDDAVDSQFTGLTKLDGFYSEQSVIEIIWDLFDSGANGNADDDGLALGFTPLYNVMTNEHKGTDSFTSIYSFIHHLKLKNPTNSAAIDTILENENISMTGADEFENPNALRLYTPLILGTTVTVDSDGDPLQTFSQWGDATTANNGGNKLLNFRFFKYAIATDGCYTFTATPDPLGSGDLVVALAKFGSANEVESTAPEIISGSLEAGNHSIAVGALSNDVHFSFGVAPAANTALCD